MIRVRFKDVGEIRMGSPYNSCRLVLTGTKVPELPETDWQDRAAYSPRKRFLGLVRWDTRGNTPGFRIFTIDSRKGACTASRRIRGLCKRIYWERGIGFKTEADRD
jgi:hypothetical protein